MKTRSSMKHDDNIKPKGKCRTGSMLEIYPHVALQIIAPMPVFVLSLVLSFQVKIKSESANMIYLDLHLHS